MIDWPEARLRGAPPLCELEFRALLSNLLNTPIFAQSNTKQEFFVESCEGPMRVWSYLLPIQNLSSQWLPFMDRTAVENTYSLHGGRLQKIERSQPSEQTLLRRIITRSQAFSHKIYRLGT